MTEEAKPAEPEAKAPPPAGKKRLLTVAGLIVGGLALGGASGIFAAGPVIAKMAAAKSDTTGAPHESAAKDSHGAPVPPSSEGTVHLVDNLVMNPAGSGGTRFLLVTVGLQMKNAAAAEEVKSRDTEVRDAILRILGSKAVEQLAEVANRETYKREIITALDRVLGGKRTVAVYFPQFVIQ